MSITHAAVHTEMVEKQGKTYRISVIPDQDCENPIENWHAMGEIYSLNRRHHNFNASAVQHELDHNPDAVPLSYFEHGNCLWTVQDELPPGADCPWDSVRLAGVWIPDRETLDEARHYGGRTRYHFMRRRAREVCSTYTQWCNGDIYGFVVEEVSTCPHCDQEIIEEIDSCWGIYGMDECLEEARSVISGHAIPA